jgi:rhodanese-related sulfurtransferase/uncharacterized membrane protein YphA (DoxX/SURF4 family)
MRRVLPEILLVTLAGALLALAANWTASELTRGTSHPLGLVLTRDYTESGTNRAEKLSAPLGTNAIDHLQAQLRAEGLQTLESNQVVQLFHDPRRLQDRVIFLDARLDDEYREGHIPGAYLFNHYHADTYLPTVLPLCQAADQIVVYCRGGTCDESLLAAKLLRSLPINGSEKLFVYVGGITEWTQGGNPVETGERGSGAIVVTPPRQGAGPSATPVAATKPARFQWPLVAGAVLLLLWLAGSSKPGASPRRRTLARYSALLARWFLAGLFIYMGLTKALHPESFLKLVREYHIVSTPVLLNFIAAALPWFEVFCGLLLVLGVAVRGAALALLAMLLPFTIAVFLRALGIANTSHIPFCAVQFDCGCGTGEVLICEKLLENLLLFLLSAKLLANSSWQQLCLRFSLLRPNPSADGSVEPKSETSVKTT